MGLREVKKQQTRERIADAARRLFAERGFDHVTVADVAREAQVALATVFNYFPTKEELFLGPLEVFAEHLVDAVRARDAGEPVLVAFRRHLDSAGGLLARIATGDRDAVEQARAMNQVIAGSSTLRARERDALAHATDALAGLIADETRSDPGDLRPYAAAGALMGVHRAMLDHVRRRVLADDDLTGLAAEVSRLGRSAFALLERGLAEYAPKPPGDGQPTGAA